MRGNDNIGEKWAWNKEIEERKSFRRFREGNPYERCFQPMRKYTRKILVSRIRGAEVNIIVGFDASNDDETGSEARIYNFSTTKGGNGGGKYE